MNNYAIITDSSCALNKAYRERFGVDGFTQGLVNDEAGNDIKASLDWEHMSPEEYFGSMAKKKKIYKSAAPGVEAIKETMRPQLEKGLDVLDIVISHALSATYNFSIEAANELAKEFPERTIKVIDSLRYSYAQGLLVIAACNNRKNGMSLEENAKWCEENKNCIHEAGPMDDLRFLARVGRISGAAGFFGSLIGIKPIGEFNEEGLTTVLGKAKGKKQAYQVCLEYLKKTIKDPTDQLILISHSGREEDAQAYAKMIQEAINPKEIMIDWVDQFCGANIGPGLCVAFYFGSPVSKGAEEEKKIITELLNA